jgi:hypothetical protein
MSAINRIVAVVVCWQLSTSSFSDFNREQLKGWTHERAVEVVAISGGKGFTSTNMWG